VWNLGIVACQFHTNGSVGALIELIGLSFLLSTQTFDDFRYIACDFRVSKDELDDEFSQVVLFLLGRFLVALAGA
jgi:hypothetical protein